MRSLPRTAAALSIAAVAVAATAMPAGAASDFDLDYPAGSRTIATFAIPNTATYGQTFVVPEGPTRIESVSFVLEVAPEAIFRGVVQAWDTSAQHPTGAPLYMSGPLSTTAATRQTVTITPDVAITPGTYVAYLSLSYDDQPVTPGASANRWAATADAYADGTFVYANNGADESRLQTDAWSILGLDSDVAFTVVFTAPPVVPPVAPPDVTPTTPAATPVILPPAYTG